MASIKELRKYQYDYHARLYPYLNNWKRDPYTFMKARFYMEMSALLVFFLLKTKVKPNTVTLAYAASGIIGGILLSMPMTAAILAGLLIFFTKGILDWSDGHLARATGQTSVTGKILDPYGALLNSIGFQVGLGLYVTSRMESVIGYYLVVALLFVRASRIIAYAKQELFADLLRKENKVPEPSDVPTDPSRKDIADPRSMLGRSGQQAVNILNSFLDDKARSVDFIILVILIEMYTGFFVSWILFSLLVMKHVSLWIGELYFVVRHGYLEDLAENIGLRESATQK